MRMNGVATGLEDVTEKKRRSPWLKWGISRWLMLIIQQRQG